jgi:crotonobetainyl-CoA:carnitine CoA-transferase CaiB-like acyl-CoA transferase
MSWVWPYQSLTGRTAGPEGNRDVCVCPADTFRCADDLYVAIAAPMAEEFKGLCTAMQRPELAADPRFKDHLTRLQDENAAVLLEIIGKWARKRKADDVVQSAEKHGFAATRILSARDIVGDENLRERGSMAFVDDPVLGPMYEFDFPVLMSKTPPKVRWSVRAVGFDNEYILSCKLGKNKDQIRDLYECKAVGRWPDYVTRRHPDSWDGRAGLILSRET